MTDSTPTPTPAEIPTTLLAGVQAPLDEALQRRGFTELTSVQQAVLDAQSEGRDLRVSSQTGSGKTVAIGLALAPHLVDEPGAQSGPKQGPTVLVLVPTRELAMQVRKELGWLFGGVRGLRIEVVMGGTSLGLERRALSGNPRIVVATPGRALDHIRGGALRCDHIAHVVLDESDRMLDLGFREDLEAILEGMPEQRHTHLVSATFPPPVRTLADRFQRDALHIEGTRLGAANSDISHHAHVLEPRDTYAAVVNLLLLNEGARCLIFVERRVDAASLAEKLSSDGFPVHPFSGELPQAQRTRTLEAFRNGTIKTLVSTDVAARGIDVPDIELVIHADPPCDADTYVHRSGRTGRAGSTGRSVMLVPPRARQYVGRILRQARIDISPTPAPSAAKVQKHLRKRFRQDIHARLTDEESPGQPQVDYAKTLLDGRDPALVVAALLDLAERKPTREPMEVREARADSRPVSRESRPGFVRFRINWGERSGAAPNRLLGHVCRRGQIRGHQVGSMEIGPTESTFEVHGSVADRFEKLVVRPDPRDPKLRIERAGHAGAGKSGPRANRSKGPNRPYPKKR